MREELSKAGAIFKVFVPGKGVFLSPSTCDGFLFAVIFEAMMIGEPLHVHGSVSAKALKNAALYCEAWANMLPADYHAIEITADTIVDDRAALTALDDRAVSAFSGGLDGIFTALRHKQRDLKAGSHDLDAVVMVHGLDVPHTEIEGFERLQKRVKPLLDLLGLPVITVWTDFRPLNRQTWGMSFSAQLSACLHLMSGMYRYALVGSSEPYSDIVLPWGSNPATDYLLSGASMEIVHDGAGYTRTEKVARIARNHVATACAKFCWEGEPDRNCGRCEKCIRTRFNFLAAVGDPYPACFDQPLDIASVSHLKLASKAIYTEFKTVLKHTQKEGWQGSWIDGLKCLVDKHATLYGDGAAALSSTGLPDSEKTVIERLEEENRRLGLTLSVYERSRGYRLWLCYNRLYRIRVLGLVLKCLRERVGLFLRYMKAL
ncbi:hypothetical protein [Candidimonas nitroreducens]|uniref:hypothetical protein n=1 Tax=Candidimonas nitroreducens TaxID=683354 RepID=UPI001178A5E3|nr:hypothetical protein [Candidimonas nitroreducens]